jgi:hypothetical protein
LGSGVVNNPIAAMGASGTNVYVGGPFHSWRESLLVHLASGTRPLPVLRLLVADAQSRVIN